MLPQLAARRLRSKRKQAIPDKIRSDIPPEWVEDPEELALKVFGLVLWDGQRKIVRAAAHFASVACRSGHKCGKSLAVALLAWWFVLTRSQSRVAITAPTGRQVKEVVWREIKALWRRAEAADAIADDAVIAGYGKALIDAVDLGEIEDGPELDWFISRRCFAAQENDGLELTGMGHAVAHRLKHNYRANLPQPALAPETGVRFPDDRQILGLSAGDPEGAAGISAPELLYIVDEASGVSEPIFEAVEGNLAGGARIVLISNPTRTSGTFFNAFHKERREWETIHISSEETPNVVAGKKLVPGLATRGWIEKRRRVWGIDDPRYQVRCRGNFPRQAANSIVALALTEAAHARFPDTEPGPRLSLGVDVARFGDDKSVIIASRGLRAYKPRAVVGYDSTEVCNLIITTLNDTLAPGEEAVVNIDVGGGYGGGVYDQLWRQLQTHPTLKGRVKVNGIDSASSPNDPQFERLRDELWFNVREWLADGGAYEEHDELDEDLLTPTYEFNIRQRIKVESKDSLKKRTGRSPDYGDALCLSVYLSRGNSAPVVPETKPRPATRWGSGASKRGY